jgi:hypothetical protein
MPTWIDATRGAPIDATCIPRGGGKLLLQQFLQSRGILRDQFRPLAFCHDLNIRRSALSHAIPANRSKTLGLFGVYTLASRHPQPATVCAGYPEQVTQIIAVLDGMRGEGECVGLAFSS